ncbi:MAG: NPCBM/NEW2 domain-containing protein, partial [Planctomycetaceae bacterium]|nr:NPCBM/NEW2 domain-containing protein [Planctomycetaceae bacterium]
MNRLRAFIARLSPLAGFALFVTVAQSADVRAEVQLVDGRSVGGVIAAIDERGMTLEANGGRESFPLNDLVSINVANVTERPTAPSWLFLSNGDRVPLMPVELTDDVIVCRWDGAPERGAWRIPLEFVTAILRAPISNDDSPLLSELSSRAFPEDTLILSDGTRLTGALEEITADMYRVETAVGPVAVEAARIVAVGMNAALVQRPRPSESEAVLLTHDGVWLTLQGLSLNGSGEVSGRTGFDAEYRVPLSDIRRLLFYGARVSDLAARQPAEVTATPFVARVPTMLANRNVRGGFLQLRGESFARGFGMTSGMSATFDLEPNDRTFQATVGIDDCVGDAGSVVFAVELDGRRVFTSPVQTGLDAPLVIGPLVVAGGERLTLRVEF